MGGDYDALPTQCVVYCRDQVGNGFSNPCSCFHQEVSFAGKRILDRGRHLKLLVAALVIVAELGEPASGADDFGWVCHAANAILLEHLFGGQRRQKLRTDIICH